MIKAADEIFRLQEENKELRAKIDALSSSDCVSRQTVLDLMQLKMGGKELYKAVYELPPVTPTHGTCKDCTNCLKTKHGLDCELHRPEDGSFEVEENFYCAYFAKKGTTCKDCRAWRPREGERGFCRRSPHIRFANESCENFEKRGAENG